MNRFIYIALFTLIGFFMNPTEMYACGTKSKKKDSCCDTKSEIQKETKSCCDKEKEEKGKNCGGSCEKTSCHCPSPLVSFILPDYNIYLPTQEIVYFKKHLNFYKETYISSGFVSLWLPPKIS